MVSAAEGVLKFFQNYFSDNDERVEKYSRAVVSLWNNFEIISAKFPLAEIKNKIIADGRRLDEAWNNFEIILLHTA